MEYANHIYEIVKRECEGMDAIYEDYIDYLVGITGLAALKEEKLIEACGILNGRQLYSLFENPREKQSM